MENNDSVPEQAMKLCANNCGFFGNAATNNMCSLCFKKTIGESRTRLEKQSESIVATPAPLPSAEEISAVSAPAAVEEIAESRPKKKAAVRCATCNKKVGLTGITCRCGSIYCGSHRYAEQHSCTFDYKAAERNELAKRNPGGGAFDKMQRL